MPLGDPITMNPNLGGEETLLGILQRLRDLSQQPLVPQNPMAQLGTILQGFSSGAVGQQNPALQMFAQQRQQQLGGLTSQGTLAATLNTLRHQRETERLAREKESRGSEDQAINVFQGILKDAKRPDERMYAAQGLQRLLGKRGVALPDQLVISMGMGSLGKTAMSEIGLGIEMGLDDTLIATKAGVDASTVAALRESFLSPQGANVRKFLGLRTKIEEQEEAGKALATVLGNAKTALELQDLGNLAKMMGKDVLPFALKLHPSKDPRELTAKEWHGVGVAWVTQDREKASLAAGLQPVSGVKDIVAAEQMAAALKQGYAKLQTKEFRDAVTPFIGPALTGARTREWWKRNLPETVAGTVPPQLTELGLLESAYQNLLVVSRTGAAANEATEFPRLMKEAPSRAIDKPEVYLQKWEHAMRVAEALRKRTVALAAVGGRNALANDMMRIWNDIPLPEPFVETPIVVPPPRGWIPARPGGR